MFDESLQIAMDYDWFLRAYRHKAKLLATPYAITHMRNSGISSQRDWKNIQKRINEEKTVHSKHSKHWAMLMCYKFWWSLYPHYKYWRSK
jgi:hypothetical protein